MIVSVVVLFVTDTRDVFIPDDVFGEEPSELENCVRTKWVRNTVVLRHLLMSYTACLSFLVKRDFQFSSFLQVSARDHEVHIYLLVDREQ